jgi:hypothetical protein
MEHPGAPDEWFIQNEMFVRRHDIVRKPEYVAEIDEFKLHNGKQFLLGHLRFHKFNKTQLKDLPARWSLFRSCVTAPIFVYAMEGGEQKFTKFIRR